MEPLSTQPRVQNLLLKLSLFTNIIPFLGYYDQVYLLYQRISKSTKEVMDQYKDLVLQESKRIHPFFLDDMRRISRQDTKGGINLTKKEYSSER